MKLNPNLICFYMLLCTTLLVTTNSDLASDRTALLAVRAAARGRTLLWNISSISPCNWTGVHCTQNRVVELRLPGMGLSGQLPIAIGNLTQLHTLSLRFNALSGSIPSDFAKLTLLRNLYLQGNRFTGEIPVFLFSLQNLIRLNLANNDFTGTIPANVNNLTRLGTLFLENNQLSGSIPDIELPTLVQFNVSFNQLNGSIPKGLSGKPKNAFEGNSLCGEPLVSCNGNGNSSSGGGGSKLSGGAIAGIVVGCVLAVLLILILLVCLCKRKRGKRTETRETTVPKQADVQNPAADKAVGETRESDNRDIGSSGVVKKDTTAKSSGSKKLVFFGNTPRLFDLDDLLRASAEVLGKGTFGTAYKATMEMGVVAVVKRLKDVVVPEKEFKEKMEVIGAMDHPNLVPIRAYYFSGDEKLVVYDYMPMGSLSALLHGNRGAGRTPLNWDTRCGIALGAARGIAYLHSKGPRISHGNIKSSNILLTTSYDARVSDFGLSQLAGPTSSPNRVDGYRAPEVTDARKVSQKADVYSFGILLLELLTGKAPMHNEEGVDLPRWVQSIVREEWTAEVFDLELLRYQNVEEDMVKLLQLATDCTAQYPDKRPSMSELTTRIEELHRSSPGRETRDQIHEANNGSSERTYSVDAGGPSS